MVDGETRAVPDLTDAQVNVLVVSDSILAFAPAHMQGFVNLLVFTRKALSTGFFVGMPLRAGLARGPIEYLNSFSTAGVTIATQSVLGRGLVDAYELEAGQEWSGGVVADEAVARYDALAEENAAAPDLATTDYLVESNLLLRRSVPVKGGRSVDAWTIPWPWGNRDRATSEMVRKSFAMHEKDPEPAEKKIDNTLEYLEAVRP